jgi:uncharacterized membrane protein
LAVLNREAIAEEVVRTLVGSIGLITAVPLATLLASAVSEHRHRIASWLGPETTDADTAA